MNARLQPDCRHRPMTVQDLDAVLAIEQAAYAFPWTRGNFIDSLAAGYRCELRLDGQGLIAGYAVAMAAVDEIHLLNLSVAPPLQGRGHARALVAALLRLAEAAWADGAALAADQALPLYLRDKVALTTAERAERQATA